MHVEKISQPLKKIQGPCTTHSLKNQNRDLHKDLQDFQDFSFPYLLALDHLLKLMLHHHITESFLWWQALGCPQYPENCLANRRHTWQSSLLEHHMACYVLTALCCNLPVIYLTIQAEWRRTELSYWKHSNRLSKIHAVAGMVVQT